MHQVKDTGTDSVPGTVPPRFAHAHASSTLRGQWGPGAKKSILTTKSGASGPKTRTRKAKQAAGVRYTQARRPTAPSSRNGHTVQFLLADRYELGTLAAQISTA
ncbi:hypothetical protein [Streptomyces sp. NBC_01314]|uniref:hypothetical protein n=1 Tax=Streptomyces sp. NBC_01314 TaxID=2903821 RepID=UPI0030898617|nr:hypothetical protein OG622_01385 [Streptomyces sp. NBC_01314]